MPLADHVSVARRFQRAIRIDMDLYNPAGLEGFVCPRSSAEVLETMAEHISGSGQGAFTWTGPYGSGKSSLVIALSALLNGDVEVRDAAAATVGIQTAQSVWKAMPPGSHGWQVLPIVGERNPPEKLFGETIRQLKPVGIRRRRNWNQQQVLGALQKMSDERRDLDGGLIIFVDEMGKFLEGASRDGFDVYFFQQLAEIASRSEGRLIVVGILHQAFEEYAHRLSRGMRDEWAKIQGRFIDLSVNAAADEQISLLGRAIEIDGCQTEFNGLFKEVAELTNRPTSGELPQLLEDCWPLHPVVASLLGPISRRRFGQNQRSLFGFLNSSEPRGFQDFLQEAEMDVLYRPDQLWEYLQLNLESSIMTSPDGHRWALAAEALERCHAYGGNETDFSVLKTIGLIDLFHERSGLTSSARLIELSLPGKPVQAALQKLQNWSLVIYRKFNDSYCVFEGSDFDIDEEIGHALESMEEVDFERLNAVASLEPIVAKRHYHETGTMRWFNQAIAPLDDIVIDPERYKPAGDAMGTFLLALPTPGETAEVSQQKAKEVVEHLQDWDLVLGLSPEAWNFSALVKELLAVEEIRRESPELQGDGVARREIEIRGAALRGQVETELERAFANAVWEAKEKEPAHRTRTGLNQLASELADERFHESPRLHNELLNRSKPSTNAVAAQNYLMHRMATQEGKERLGIDGFPAEGGLFASILEHGQLYSNRGNKPWRFVVPRPKNDPCNLRPVWDAATNLLERHRQRTVSLDEIYQIWYGAPFGVKDGLLPVLGAAFILCHRRKVAFYRQGVFQAQVTDLDMDILAKTPSDIGLRWMGLSQRSRDLLARMASIVRELDHNNALTDLEPIDVAKGLVAIYGRLPSWVGRTQRLSTNAKQVRQLFKQASDPNGFVFDDIPRLLSSGNDRPGRQALEDIATLVREGLLEMQQAYPEMLRRLRDTLLAELQVPNISSAMLTELRNRADNVKNLAGDHRLEAFVIRLCEFDASDGDMESLASMAANKPARNWVDSDIDRASIEIAELARHFMRAESFAHVKGRRDMRHSMAVTVGLAGRPITMSDEFEITNLDRTNVDRLIAKMRDTLGEEPRHVILAALAELSADYLESTTIKP